MDKYMENRRRIEDASFGLFISHAVKDSIVWNFGGMKSQSKSGLGL